MKFGSIKAIFEVILGRFGKFSQKKRYFFKTIKTSSSGTEVVLVNRPCHEDTIKLLVQTRCFREAYL